MTNIEPFLPHTETYSRPNHPTKSTYRLVCHAFMDATRIAVVVLQRVDDSMCLVIPHLEFVEQFRPETGAKR